MVTAYNNAAGMTNPTATELGAGDIGGMTLAPGLYKWSTDVIIPTDVTLSGGANDVWIFQIAGNLTMSSATHVILSGGAQASNVFWQVGGVTGATLGTYSTFNGNILSAKQVIIDTGAALNGRALAQTEVTLDANPVSVPSAVTTHTITASVVGPSAIGPKHGTIDPLGLVSVNDGSNQTFAITPDPGYQINTLTVDGSPIATTTNYTFSDITGNYTIIASFSTIPAPAAAVLTVIKTVSGGMATSSDFSIHVKNGGNEVTGSPQLGSSTGTPYTLSAGTYAVSESGGPANYISSFSGDCNSGGIVSLTAGQIAKCTMINTFNNSSSSTSTIFTLTVTKTGDGTGNVSSGDEQGINCGGTCTRTYSSGTVVTLTATPDPDSNFNDTWSGGGCSGSGTCVVTITGNTVVNANFSLNTSTVGGGLSGTVSSSTTGTLSGTVSSAGGGGSSSGGGGSSSGGGGSSSGGGGAIVPSGLVLGTSTNVPSGGLQYPGSVLGTSMTLPRTGVPVDEILALLAISGTASFYILQKKKV
jgi:hypothetical protein